MQTKRGIQAAWIIKSGSISISSMPFALKINKLSMAPKTMEHRIPINQEWIIEDRTADIAKIYVDPKSVLIDDMPTAFVCNCDLTASYVIKILQEAGYKIPEDISIVGFDNYLYPGMCNIGITSYEVDFKEMARRTIHNLIKKIVNPDYKPGVVIVQGKLVYKESVARI